LTRPSKKPIITGTFRNANVPKPVNKPKPVLIKIEFTKEQKEEIKRIWEGKPPKK